MLAKLLQFSFFSYFFLFFLFAKDFRKGIPNAH